MKTVKIFVGVEFTTDIDIKLKDSLLWKETSFAPTPDSLVRIPFHGNDYIGRYVTEMTVKDLKEIERQILNTLHSYSSEINIEKLNPVVFSQDFAL